MGLRVETVVSGSTEQPFTYAYRYPAWPPNGATVIRFGTNGREINGCKPIEAIPLYSLEQAKRILRAPMTQGEEKER